MSIGIVGGWQGKAKNREYRTKKDLPKPRIPNPLSSFFALQGEKMKTKEEKYHAAAG
jgi:hypothetical protein